MVFLPLTLTFVIASRHSGARARRRGTQVLIEGCALQVAGLAVLVLAVASVKAPGALLLALVLAIFGYGQGLVMAPLSSTVLSTVNPASAGSGAGMYGTTTQIANAAGVAAIGAVFFAVEAAGSARLGDVRRIGAVCAVDYDECRISVMDAPRALTSIVTMPSKIPGAKFSVNDSTRPFYFAVQQLSGLG